LLNDLTKLSAPWRFNSSFKRQVAARGSEIGSNSGFQESKTDGQAEKYGPLPHLQQDQEYPVGETQEAEFVRLPVHCPEVDYRDQLNALISDARRNTHQYSMVQVEPGLHYLASYGARPEALSTLTGKLPGSLIVSFINELKYDSLGYYPFSLSICDTEAWYDFCSGKLMLCVFVETKAIQDKLSRHGIKSEITGQWISIRSF